MGVNTRTEVDSTYIQSTYNNLQFRFDINTLSSQINFDNPGLREFNLEPNENFRTRITAAYRWLNLSYSFTPQIGSLNDDDSEKGAVDVFGIDLNLNFKALQQHAFYRKTNGYYLTNSDDYREDLIANGIADRYVVLPDIETTQIGLENYYYFNKNRFSSRFARTQNEVQLKSAGSPIAFLGAYYADLDGRKQDFDFLSFLPEVEGVYPARNQNLYAAVGGGYAYNYIFQKNFYITAQLVPVIGVQWSKVELSDEITETSSTDFTVGLLSEASVGYNSKKWFGGAYMNYGNYDSPNANFRVSGEQAFVMFFVGYRFKAPKFLEKTFDGIENIFNKKE